MPICFDVQACDRRLLLRTLGPGSYHRNKGEIYIYGLSMYLWSVPDFLCNSSLICLTQQAHYFESTHCNIFSDVFVSTPLTLLFLLLLFFPEKRMVMFELPDTESTVGKFRRYACPCCTVHGIPPAFCYNRSTTAPAERA